MSTTLPRVRLYGFALAAVLFLAACDTAEERAEGHYQSGLELLADGDVDRALIEFRNVFKLDGLHREARLTYAEVMRDQGEFQEAYSHYLLLSEQYPDDALPRKWLFRLAMLGGDIEEASVHGTRARRIAPEDPEVRAIDTIMAYTTALEDRRPGDRRDAAQRLTELASEIDDPQLYLPTIVDNHIRDAEFHDALAAIEKLLATDATLEQWQALKLRILNQLGDEPAIKEQLETMVTLFPEASDYPTALVQWHLSREEPQEAEDFLRRWIDTAEGEVKTERQVQLVAFLSSTKGPDAAVEELAALINQTDSDGLPMFRSMQAGLLFDRGDRDEAIDSMAAIVDEAGEELTAEQESMLHDIEVNLALMLIDVGREDEARARIASVLEKEDGHVGALKQHSAWLIEADRADDAIVDLRTALGRAPEDPQIMSLIAEAHIRNGSRDLAGEMLALAVEASGNASEESLSYARFLIADRAYRPAEDVLLNALRRAPANLDLLSLLGGVYIQSSDWARVEQAEQSLRRIGTESAIARADGLKVDSLRAQQRGEEALRFLTELAGNEEGNVAAEIAVARTHMANGNFDQAQAFIESRLAEEPSNAEMRMLQAALYSQTDRAEEAERILRRLVEEDPTREIVWRTLYESTARTGDAEAATAILTEALEALPESPDLLWAKAGELERGGDVNGAIEIYQALYDRLPNSPIIANNLASLLSVHFDEPETIDRAYAIARRLRGSDVPAFQDTYGWLAHLRGQTEEAVEHLEAAANALPTEPLVQYHLGMAYSAAERPKAAINRLTNAIELFGEADTWPQVAIATAEIERLEKVVAELEAEENGN